MSGQRYSEQLKVLLDNVGNLLENADPVTRLRALRRVVEGVELVEQCVVSEANQQGLAWAKIGEVYGVTRQSAHKRFAGVPVASAEVFAWLSANDEDEVGGAMGLAAARAVEVVKTGRGVHL